MDLDSPWTFLPHERTANNEHYDSMAYADPDFGLTGVFKTAGQYF